MKPWQERIYNGVVKENPALVLMLGMCPTLAVTTSATNGFGMGVSTMVVLIASNVLISLLRKVIPDEVRLPAYIVVVASLVTVVELLTEAYLPSLYSALGIYIPLIVVNCIILGRAEAFASKNAPFLSAMDGVGMGLGFTIALTIIGLVREFLGAGTLFGASVLPDWMNPIAIFIKAPGAFLVIAFVVAVMNACGMMTKANDKVEGCDGCCATCATSCKTEAKEEQ
jgi:electron transport complex protein RnfE